MDWFYLILIFLAVALSILAGYFVVVDLVRRDEQLAIRRVEELRKDVASAPAASPALFHSLSQFDLGEFARPRPAPPPSLLPTLLQHDWLRPLRNSLARSDLPFRLDQVLTASVVLALVLGTIGLWWQGPLLGAPFFLGGAAAPLMYVARKARARRDHFVAHMGGAFELMSRVIRSGQSVPQAFKAVADSFDEPIAGAFARCREQQNMGLPAETAFQELAEHSGVLEMRIFVMAMVIQRQSGGNLSDVLERLAVLIRERRRVRQQIRTLTAEGRMQASILLVLPFFMFVVMRIVNRDYADELLHQRSLLAAMVFVMGIGALWIRKIVNFEIQRREPEMSTWFSLVAFLGTSFLVMLVFLFLNRDNFRIAARARGLSGTATARPMADQIREVLIRLPLGAALLGGSAARQAELRKRFARAGIYSPHASSIFLSVKVLLASAGAALAVGVGLMHLIPPKFVLAVGLILIGLGVIAPGLWLDSRIGRWQSALRRGLPDAMDMLVLCLEGGASLNSAFQHLLDELRVAHPELGAEMDIVHHEMMLGKTAGEAIGTFGQRCGLEDVRTLASVLLQNERYGVSVGKALRIHADFMRQQRQQRAEETAQKAAVKILFPTILCIFPAIFIVILGPAALRIAAVFAQMK